jgi:hypothetical protein
MKKILVVLLTGIILFSNIIIFKDFNDPEKSIYVADVDYSIQDDRYFNLLSPNDTWSEYTIDSDSNGLIDLLNIRLAINTTEELFIYGVLKEPSGTWLGYTQNMSENVPEVRQITLSFPGNTIYAAGYSGVYLLYIMIQNSGDTTPEVDFRLLFSTENYNYFQFERPTGIFTGFDDYGVDTDNDSLYNELNIDFYVNISEAGMYAAAVMLNHDDPFNQTIMRYLGVGIADLPIGNNQIITARVPTTSFSIDKLNGPYSLGFVYLMKQNENNDMIFQQFGHNIGFTQAYSYLQFDPAPAYFTGAIYDFPVDSEGEPKFEEIRILVELNVSEPGDYGVEMFYQMGDQWTFSDNDSFYSTGLYNVSFTISDSEIYAVKFNGSIFINQFSLIDSSYSTLQILTPDYHTREYIYTQFNPPGLLLTGQYFDHGIDLDNDSYFNELQILIGVNVTVADDYYFDISLGDPVNQWEYTSTYLEVGVHNISFNFPMNDYYQKSLNSSFTIDYLSIADGTYNQIHYDTSGYTTRIYNYTEFDRPSILFTLTFQDYGLDLNNNSFYDALVIGAEVNVFEAGNFIFNANIKSNTSPTSYYFYSYADAYLEPGLHNISFIFSDVYNEKLDCTYHLNYVAVQDENYQAIDRVYDPYDTAYYSYTEFEPPQFSVSYFADYGYSDTNDSLFNIILLEFEITLSSPGEYIIEVGFNAISLNHELFSSIQGIFPAATIPIQIPCDPSFIGEDSWQTEFLISVYIMDANWNILYEARDCYTTRTYASTEFIQFSTTTTFPDPEDTTTEITTTTTQPRLSPGFTILLALFAVIPIKVVKKRKK